LLDVENSAKLFTLLEKENFSPSYQHLVPSDDQQLSQKTSIISLNCRPDWRQYIRTHKQLFSHLPPSSLLKTKTRFAPLHVTSRKKIFPTM